MMIPPHARVLDVTRYQWTQSHDTPTLWQREALGGENLWLYGPKEVRELFLGGTLLLSRSTELGRISSAAREAWGELRVQHPEIALTTHVDSNGRRLFEFRLPKSDNETQRWVERTLIIGTGSKEPSFSALRSDVIQKKCDTVDTALLYLHVECESSEEDINTIRFLLNLDHLCTDGIGIRIIAGFFFHLFAQKLSSGKHVEKADLKWQGGASKLSPPWISIMNDKQKTSGVEFDAAVARQFQFSQQSAKNWGLPLVSQPHIQPSGPEFHFLSLTKPQSISLLKAIKSKLGTTATITHLCHASVILALIRAFPVPRSNKPQSLLTPCIMNGRRYLVSSLSPERTYIPTCQATGEVYFPDLHDYNVTLDTPRSNLWRTLKQAFGDAERSYDAIKRRKSILSESMPMMEHLGDEMFKSQKSQKPRRVPERAEPFLLSDGIGE